MSTPLTDQVRAVVADVLELPLARVDEDASQDTLSTWDSLGHLNIALSLEARFDVKLSPAEIEQIRSIRAITDLLEARLNDPSSPA